MLAASPTVGGQAGEAEREEGEGGGFGEKGACPPSALGDSIPGGQIPSAAQAKEAGQGEGCDATHR